MFGEEIEEEEEKKEGQAKGCDSENLLDDLDQQAESGS